MIIAIRSSDHHSDKSWFLIDYFDVVCFVLIDCHQQHTHTHTKIYQGYYDENTQKIDAKI